jgi:hypothetical protein
MLIGRSIKRRIWSDEGASDVMADVVIKRNILLLITPWQQDVRDELSLVLCRTRDAADLAVVGTEWREWQFRWHESPYDG